MLVSLSLFFQRGMVSVCPRKPMVGRKRREGKTIRTTPKIQRVGEYLGHGSSLNSVGLVCSSVADFG